MRIGKKINHSLNCIKLVLTYFVAQICVLLQYKRAFLKGKYFTSRWFNIGGQGWRIVIHYFWSQKVSGINKEVPWPVDPTIKISNWKNIEYDPDDMHIFWSKGIYYQATKAKIFIGKGTLIAPNVGLITTNHELYSIERHTAGKPIILGEKCWIGMNSVLLPGVTLGDHTVVGAGSVVTKSFPEGYCVIAGNPAKVIKKNIETS